MDRREPKFQTLDAMRGVAAIAVMGFHAPIFGRTVMPGGYLAVDLFFMLSGFVIALSYQQRMASGYPLSTFILHRAVRLWPMVALGAIVTLMLYGGSVGGIFLIPDITSSGRPLYENHPMWSLLMEALAYCAFGVVLWRLGPWTIAAMTALLGAVLAIRVMGGAILMEMGPFWPTIQGGMLRVGFGFGTGLLLWHLWRIKRPVRRKTHLAWLPVLMLLMILALVPQDGDIIVLLTIFVTFPLLLWLGLCWEMPDPRLPSALGDLSYPLYCIHAPLLLFLVTDALTMAATMIILPIAALALFRYVDVPARRFLLRTTRLGKKPDQTRIGIST